MKGRVEQFAVKDFLACTRAGLGRVTAYTLRHHRSAAGFRGISACRRAVRAGGPTTTSLEIARLIPT